MIIWRQSDPVAVWNGCRNTHSGNNTLLLFHLTIGFNCYLKRRKLGYCRFKWWHRYSFANFERDIKFCKFVKKLIYDEKRVSRTGCIQRGSSKQVNPIEFVLLSFCQLSSSFPWFADLSLVCANTAYANLLEKKPGNIKYYAQTEQDYQCSFGLIKPTALQSS
jgi:hypothetical protein